MKPGRASLGIAEKSSTGPVTKSPGTGEEYVADAFLLLNCRRARMNLQMAIDVMLRNEAIVCRGPDAQVAAVVALSGLAKDVCRRMPEHAFT